MPATPIRSGATCRTTRWRAPTDAPSPTCSHPSAPTGRSWSGGSRLGRAGPRKFAGDQDPPRNPLSSPRWVGGAVPGWRSGLAAAPGVTGEGSGEGRRRDAETQQPPLPTQPRAGDAYPWRGEDPASGRVVVDDVDARWPQQPAVDGAVDLQSPAQEPRPAAAAD